MSNTITRALTMGAAALALTGAAYAGTAIGHATPMRAVCDGIDESPSYEAYVISSWALGVAVHADQDQQARNILDSISVYCPWHGPGIITAAKALS